MAITVFQGGPTFFILRLLLIRLVLIAPHISFSRKFFRTTILISSSQKALYVLSLIIFEAFVLLQWLSSSRRVFTHSLTTFSPTYSPGVNFVSFLKIMAAVLGAVNAATSLLLGDKSLSIDNWTFKLFYQW